jgi:hypothetical protein
MALFSIRQQIVQSAGGPRFSFSASDGRCTMRVEYTDGHYEDFKFAPSGSVLVISGGYAERTTPLAMGLDGA